MCGPGTLTNLQDILGDIILGKSQGIEGYIYAAKDDVVTNVIVQMYQNKKFKNFEFQMHHSWEIHNISFLKNKFADEYGLNKKDLKEDKYLAQIENRTFLNRIRKKQREELKNTIEKEETITAFVERVADKIIFNLPILEGSYHDFNSVEKKLNILDLFGEDFIKRSDVLLDIPEGEYEPTGYKKDYKQRIQNVVKLYLHEQGYINDQNIELTKLKIELANNLDKNSYGVNILTSKILEKAKKLDALEEFIEYAIDNNIKIEKGAEKFFSPDVFNKPKYRDDISQIVRYFKRNDVKFEFDNKGLEKKFKAEKNPDKAMLCLNEEKFLTKPLTTAEINQANLRIAIAENENLEENENLDVIKWARDDNNNRKGTNKLKAIIQYVNKDKNLKLENQKFVPLETLKEAEKEGYLDDIVKYVIDNDIKILDNKSKSKSITAYAHEQGIDKINSSSIADCEIKQIVKLYQEASNSEEKERLEKRYVECNNTINPQLVKEKLKNNSTFADPLRKYSEKELVISNPIDYLVNLKSKDKDFNVFKWAEKEGCLKEVLECVRKKKFSSELPISEEKIEGLFNSIRGVDLENDGSKKPKQNIITKWVYYFAESNIQLFDKDKNHISLSRYGFNNGIKPSLIKTIKEKEIENIKLLYQKANIGNDKTKKESLEKLYKDCCLTNIKREIKEKIKTNSELTYDLVGSSGKRLIKANPI